MKEEGTRSTRTGVVSSLSRPGDESLVTLVSPTKVGHQEFQFRTTSVHVFPLPDLDPPELRRRPLGLGSTGFDPLRPSQTETVEVDSVVSPRSRHFVPGSLVVGVPSQRPSPVLDSSRLRCGVDTD